MIEKSLMQILTALDRLILHRYCHVKFNDSLYSAPFTLVRQTLWLRATDLTVAIFQDYRQSPPICAVSVPAADERTPITCHQRPVPSLRTIETRV